MSQVWARDVPKEPGEASGVRQVQVGILGPAAEERGQAMKEIVLEKMLSATTAAILLELLKITILMAGMVYLVGLHDVGDWVGALVVIIIADLL